MKFIVDAHLDLAMNAMEWNRDLADPLKEINAREKDLKDKPDRGNAAVSLEEMRKGNIGLCVATQIARNVKQGHPLPGWNSAHQAWAHTQGQLAWYQSMQKAGELRQIRNSLELTQHLDRWNGGDQTIGFVLSLEGADSIIDHSYLETAYQYGLRAIGLGHYGPGTYAHGTNADAPLNEKGKSLVKRIEELGLIMDLTHLCDQAFWDVLEIFSGSVWASHNNCRAIVDHNRQFSDAQILEIIQRKGVIGVVFDAWMIIPGWQKGKSTPKEMGLNLDHIIHHIDHICQLAGNADHVGIGSDLDGGFGKEQCPADLETIADLQKLDYMLSERGYKEGDIEKILSINFLSFLRENLSKH